MKKERFTLGDCISIIIAFAACLVFLAVFIACYLWYFSHEPSMRSFVGIALASIFPGLLFYGTLAGMMEFVREK